MSRVLPGSAKYANRRCSLVVPQPCSVQSCNDPAHASYKTASGYQFCMSHRCRYLLLLLAQHLCNDGWMTLQDDVKRSELRIWIDLAIDGNDESVEQHMKVHKDDCVKFHIDESIL